MTITVDAAEEMRVEATDREMKIIFYSCLSWAIVGYCAAPYHEPFHIGRALTRSGPSSWPCSGRYSRPRPEHGTPA
jgi:hypothetical protein